MALKLWKSDAKLCDSHPAKIARTSQTVGTKSAAPDVRNSSAAVTSAGEIGEGNAVAGSVSCAKAEGTPSEFVPLLLSQRKRSGRCSLKLCRHL